MMIIITSKVKKMRLDMSVNEFKEQIKLVYNNMNNFLIWKI